MRERAREADDAELCRDHVRAPFGPLVRGETAEIHDAAALREIRQAGLRAMKCAVEDGGEDLAPLLVGHVRESGLGTHGRVVDEQVEAAEFLHARGNHGIDGRAVGDVGELQGCASAARADVGDRLPGLGARAARMHEHCGARAGELQSDGAPDVARGAGHERDFARKLPFLLHGAIVAR
jgi:hypothetical protein